MQFLNEETWRRIALYPCPLPITGRRDYQIGSCGRLNNMKRSFFISKSVCDRVIHGNTHIFQGRVWHFGNYACAVLFKGQNKYASLIVVVCFW